MIHKQSAKYFFENAKKAEKNAKRFFSSSEPPSLCRPDQRDLTSSEFQNRAPDLPPLRWRLHRFRCCHGRVDLWLPD